MKEKEAMAVEILVTPSNAGGQFECDISGSDVIDEAILLPRNGTFEIGFTLDDASDWSWNEQDPFCAKPGKCPPVGASQHGLLRVSGTPAAKRFTAIARPTGSKRVFHYRLNFANGDTYDPIIIRD